MRRGEGRSLQAALVVALIAAPAAAHEDQAARSRVLERHHAAIERCFERVRRDLEGWATAGPVSRALRLELKLTELKIVVMGLLARDDRGRAILLAECARGPARRSQSAS